MHNGHNYYSTDSSRNRTDQIILVLGDKQDYSCQIKSFYCNHLRNNAKQL